MPDAQHCLAMADEAERLASIVSYGRDKLRLKEQAQNWREQAEAMANAPNLSNEGRRPGGVIGWLRRRQASNPTPS